MFSQALMDLVGNFAQLEPVDTLAKFEEDMANSLQDLEHDRNPEKIQASLDYILDILIREEAASNSVSETGVCTEAFLNGMFFEKVVKLNKDCRTEIKTIILSFASSLVSMMGIHFLFSGNVHQPLSALIDDKSMDSSDQLVELEYHLAIKILESPELLDIFYIHSDKEDVKPKFPIYDHLIQSLHLEGQNGDFARAAFEFLTRSCENADLEKYLLSTDFCSIVMASLAGLYAQLPDVLPGLVDISSQRRREFQADLNGFQSLYIFVQSCITKCPSKSIVDQLILEFEDFLLGQVMLSGLNSCSDFDGSAITSLYYIQRIIDLTTEPKLLASIARFLLLIKEDKEDSLSARDLMLSKLHSLSEEVVIDVLRILSTLLTKDGGLTVQLLFPCLDSDKDTGLSDPQSQMTLITKYIGILPKNIGGPSSSKIDAYLAEAIRNLPKQQVVNASDDSKADDGKNFQSRVLELLEDHTLQKLFSKLDFFFSQSMQINIALTGVFSLLASQPNPILFAALFSDSTGNNSLLQSFTKLFEESKAQQDSITNYNVRLMLARQRVLSNDSVQEADEMNIEGEFLKNVVCLEEFSKEIVSLMLMKEGSLGTSALES